MLSNLIYYGLALGLGAILSLTLKDEGKRSFLLVFATIVAPVGWTLMLAGFDLEKLKSLQEIVVLYDIERNLTIYSGKYAAALGIMPFLWSLCFFATIWIERSLWIQKRKSYQDTGGQ